MPTATAASSPLSKAIQIRQKVKKGIEQTKGGGWPENSNGDEFFKSVAAEAHSLANQIIESAKAEDRDLDSKESDAADSLFATFDMAMDFHQLSQTSRGRKTSPHAVCDGSAFAGWNSGGEGSQWADAETGQPIKLIASDEKAVDNIAGWNAGGGYGADHGVPVEELVAAIFRGTSSSQSINAAMQTTRDSAGGYALSPRMSAEVVDLARAKSTVIAAGARTMMMPTEVVRMISIDSDPSGDWIPEGAELPTTDVALGSRGLRAHKYATIIPITHELVRSAANLVDEVRRLLGVAIAQAVDSAALSGDGVEKPHGVLSDTDITETARVGDSNHWDELLIAQEAIENRNGMATAAILSPTAYAKMIRLKASDGQYLQPPAALSDLRRITSTKMSATGKAVVGDFREYLIGIREGFRLEISKVASLKDGRGFGTDHVLYKVAWSGDGMPLRPSHFHRITGLDDSAAPAE